jgi:tripartite-type tricarboxylate transporter receptor subunit TctC
MLRWLVAVLGAAVVIGVLPAHAQPYPSKPVRVIAPFPPGAGVDIVTRIFTPKLAEALGQQFIVDNRSGAAGHIGAELAARAAPDGYTLLLAPSSIVISQTLYPRLTYKTSIPLRRSPQHRSCWSCTLRCRCAMSRN